ncbi:MAG: hypothetical protein JNM79_02615 [Burkholderiales bacterium]|nr:hypothetical protein [Burkholderiales bacterium]
MLAFALSQAGCTVVRIQAPSKDGVEVKQRFGIVSVSLSQQQGPVIVESTNLGAINGYSGFSLGFRQETLAQVGGCQIVLWIKTNESLAELNRLLADKTDVCTIRSDGTIERK